MKSLRHIAALAVLIIAGCTMLSAQHIAMPNVNVARHESEAMKAVRELPKRGGAVKGEEYNHLHIFAAQFIIEQEWMVEIESGAEFLDAVDLTEPVDFSASAEQTKKKKKGSGTHFYADYIYDSEGRARWIYSNDVAVAVGGGASSAQGLVDEALRHGFDLVFKVKDVREGVLFGISGGKLCVIAQDEEGNWATHSFGDFTAEEGVAKSLLRPMTYKKAERAAALKSASESGNTLPMFRGGDLTYFRQWVVENMMFPKDLYGRQIGGRVVASFVVNAKGRVEWVEIVEADNEQLAKSVYDLLERSPKWTPGRQNGIPVAMQYTLPLNFQVAQ